MGLDSPQGFFRTAFGIVVAAERIARSVAQAASKGCPAEAGRYKCPGRELAGDGHQKGVSVCRRNGRCWPVDGCPMRTCDPVTVGLESKMTSCHAELQTWFMVLFAE